MTALTEPQKALIRVRIAEAEAARHNAFLNKTVSRITDQNGETVTFGGGYGLRAIDRYIADLKAMLPGEFCKPASYGPIGFVFGRAF